MRLYDRRLQAADQKTAATDKIKPFALRYHPGSFCIIKRCFLSMVFFVLLMFGCQEKIDNEIVKRAAPDIDKYLVSAAQARQIAENLNMGARVPAKKEGRVASLILNQHTVQVDNKPCYHIINYQDDKGFVVLSADRRTMPLLAYSDHGIFDVNDMAPELEEWQNDLQDFLVELRKSNEAPVPVIITKWHELAICFNFKVIPGENPDAPCKEEAVEKSMEPLLKTAWGQTCGFNDFCPPREKGPCGHAPAGCIPVAMAQVIRYHEGARNRTFNWSIMSDYGGSPEAARLIADVGKSMVWPGMTYWSDRSFIPPDKIEPTLASVFGYIADMEFVHYDVNKVIAELAQKRPVIFSGSGKTYKNWHVWVCDGYRYVDLPCDGLTYTYLHMNWGWKGDANGWFFYSNFLIPVANEPSLKYTRRLKTVVGIRYR